MSPATSTALLVAGPDAPAPRLDFPTWLPAMLVKELRQGLRTRGFVFSFLGVQVVMMIAFFYAAQQSDNEASLVVDKMFWGLFFIVLLVFTPLRALGGLGGRGGEIESRTVDLLVLTRLTAFRIVLGKWVSLIAQATLLATSLLPYGVLRYYLGSVDLVQDLVFMVLLLAGCALLTAFGLWVSSWPRPLRWMLGVVFVLALLNFNNLYYEVREIIFELTVTPTLVGWPKGLFILILVYDGVLFMVFSLVQAARRLAPPAENYAAPTRLIGILALLPPPLLAMGVGVELARAHGVLSAATLLVVCGLELSLVARPLRSQVRPWLSAGWRRLCGPLLLPGWPSAALFTVVALLQMLVDMGPWFSLPLLLWWLTLAWVALVFPILLITSRPNFARFPRAGYWIVQGLLGILSLFSLSDTLYYNSKAILIVTVIFKQMVPGASFWLGSIWMKPTPSLQTVRYIPEIVFGQLVILGLVILLYLRLSRPYWKIVRSYAASPISEPGSPPA